VGFRSKINKKKKKNLAGDYFSKKTASFISQQKKMSSRARKVANLKKESSHTIKDVKKDVKLRSVSTAISDAVLALTSFGCAFMNTNTFAGYFGFLIIGLAAFIGTCKFSGLHQLDYFHKLAR